MRTPSDLPPRQRRGRLGDRGRVILIGAAVLLVVLLFSVRFLSGFFIDYLWHTSVGRGNVFWGVLTSKLLLFGMFGAAFIGIAVVNLVIADRLAPAAFSANMHPVVERFHEIFGKRLRMARFIFAVVVGLLFALPAMGHWQDWLLFRNSQSFGIKDAQFGNDIGFYIFRLPFLTFVLDWFYAAVIFVILLVIVTHILNGGVIIQPPRPKVRRATKAHVAVLLALLAIVKAADYWVSRYELTTERRGFVQGATYSVVNAQLPAVLLLMLIALLVAGLFLSTLKTDSWRLPVVASALWVVIALLGGVIYPAAIQALVVNPNQKDREAVFIERNITATRQALGIGDVTEQNVTFGNLSASALQKDIAPLQAARLLNPTALVGRFRTDQGQRAGLTIRDLDIDRYDVNGQKQQVLIAARELDLDTVANKSWQGQHLISTHGCGLIRASASRVETSGRPSYEDLPLTRPELYFSEGLSGYAVVGTSVKEDVCQGQDNVGAYSGQGGVALDSAFRRVMFALSFFDYNLLGSSAIDDGSRLLWIRNVRERVAKVAPFLSFDGDPYPVALDGNVVWVIDGYTTSARYPYAQNADLSQLGANSGLDFDFNYIRNSVKAVVNAYDGSMAFYVVDEKDPIIRAWSSAFPNLFAPRSAMPAGLEDHLRYPEELFRIQTAAYSKYRLSPDVFFDRTGAWSVAQGPSTVPRLTAAAATDASTGSSTQSQDFATESSSARFVPYYSMFRAPGDTTTSFQLLRPFVPFSTDDARKDLQAFMVASSDRATYGQLRAYVVSGAPDGPATVAATMESDTSISGQITLLDQGNSSIIYGDLQLVPIAGGLLYLRPLYVQSDAASQPSYRYMLASYNGRAAYGATLEEVLAKLFPGFSAKVGDVVGTDSSVPTEPDTPVVPETPSTGDTPESLLKQADSLFAEADQALKDSDLTAYAQKVAAARELVRQALEMLQAPSN
jgi:hypothetical protein